MKQQYSIELPDFNKREMVTVTTDTPVIACEDDYDEYCYKCNMISHYCCGYEYKDKFYCEFCILDVVKESNK